MEEKLFSHTSHYFSERQILQFSMSEELHND